MKQQYESYRFTPETRKVFDLAQQEAQRLRHPYVGTEHLLLALLQDKESSAVHVLEKCGTNTDEIQQKVMHVLRRELRPSFIRVLKAVVRRKHSPIKILDVMPLTRRARVSLGIAAREAKRKGDHMIDSIDLLLGLVSEGGIAALSLQELSIDATAIRAHR